MDAEIFARHIFQLVGFVEDNRVVFGDDSVQAFAAKRHIGEKEVMVYHDNIGVGGLISKPREMAAGKFGALASEAVFGTRAHIVPGPEVIGQPGDVGALAGRRGHGPFLEPSEKSGFLAVKHARLVAKLKEAAPAKIISAALEADYLELGVDVLPEKGDVVIEDLILKGLCAGRHYDFFAAKDCGNKIGPGFARAGAGFGHEGPGLAKGLENRAGHIELAGPGLKAFDFGGKDTFGAEIFIHRQTVWERAEVFFGRGCGGLRLFQAHGLTVSFRGRRPGFFVDAL